MTENLKKLAERCEKVGLKTKSYTYKVNDPDPEEEVIEHNGLIIQIPEERESKNIIILEDNEFEQVEQSEFEFFKFIKGYEAVWSQELGIVEGELQSNDTIRGGVSLMRRLRKFFRTSEDNESSSSSSSSFDEDYSFEFPSPNENVKIIIGTSSLEFSILTSLQREYFFFRERIRPKPTIRVEGLSIATHNEAKTLLANIANSVFFQIDISVNIPLHLTIDRELFRDIRLRRLVNTKNLEISSPKYEYDLEPMFLYWYA